MHYDFHVAGEIRNYYLVNSGSSQGSFQSCFLELAIAGEAGCTNKQMLPETVPAKRLMLVFYV